MIRTTRLFALVAYAVLSLFPLQLSAATPHDCHERPGTPSTLLEEHHATHAPEWHAADGMPDGAPHDAGAQHTSHHGSATAAERISSAAD